MWPWHSPLKYSHVWVKTSICLPEQHLHSAWSQEVLISTASDLHSRGNRRKRQMQLSSLKTSQDREDSVLTLAEQNLKSIFSDPLCCEGLRFSPCSALCLHLKLLQLPLPLWASKITSPSSSHVRRVWMKRDLFLHMQQDQHMGSHSCHTWEYLSLKGQEHRHMMVA